MNRPPDRTAIRRRLLAWFDRHQRDLPWRHDRDPYRIWVSEVMLQQTTVAAVIPYFHRFLAAFPTLTLLAAADEQDVLRLWEGLGYYRRARHLHKAARMIVERHGGSLPDDPAVWTELPGIGRYILGAVLSQAFDRRLPIVEANSQRVLCRLFGERRDPSKGPVKRWLWQTATELLPAKRVGDFNQAMMELGALVCTPTAPKCRQCPLARQCEANRLGQQASIPVRTEPPTPVDVRMVALAIRKRGRVLLAQRSPTAGRWSNMWELPNTEVARRESLATAATRLLKSIGVTANIGKQFLTVRHGVTHHRITLAGFDATWVRGKLQSPEHSQSLWLRTSELANYPASSAQRKLIRAVSHPKSEIAMRAFVIVLSLAVIGFLWWSFRSTKSGGLLVGVAAPNFTAKSLDDKPFALGDLRGKVVVLDFWATWCPPCVAMIPHERELVQRLAGKPFAFVGISADQDLDALRTMVSSKSMNWTHIADGPGGPIQQQFGIEYYPSVFVLDSTGVIRYRDVRGKELDKAVDTLLAEMAKK